MKSGFRNLVPKNLIDLWPMLHNFRDKKCTHRVAILLALGWLCQGVAICAEPGLVGLWKLKGDCRDYSGQGNHGVNHSVDLEHGAFDGAKSFIEVPASDSLKLGKGDFAICAWVNAEKELDDIVGDVVDMYDPALRRGITLSINSSSGGY